MESMVTKYCQKVLKINKLYFFFLIVVLNICMFVINNRLILTKEVYYNSYIEQLSIERIDNVVEEGRKWHMISIFFIPLLLMVKVSFTSSCLFIGLLFKGFRSAFMDVFNIALKAELVFMLGNIIRITVLLGFKEIEDFGDLNYYPLSLLSITGTKDIYPWLVYSLQSFNFFELAYWLLLAKGLTINFKKDYSAMLMLVISTYVVGFVLWILTVMLLLMNIM